MSNTYRPGTYRIEAYFEDPRPVGELKYEIERRVKRLLERDPARDGKLVFVGAAPPHGTGTVIELSLEAALEGKNVYALRIDFSSSIAHMQRVFDGWTEGLALREKPAQGAESAYREVASETLEQEAQAAAQLPRDDLGAIRAIQENILQALRQGKLFFSANKEGGMHIRYLQDRYVFQAYGEDETREEFASAAEFLVRLRKFYDAAARFSWYPHTLPEMETWRFIERQLKSR